MTLLAALTRLQETSGEKKDVGRYKKVYEGLACAQYPRTDGIEQAMQLRMRNEHQP